jgi:hypothetical protein
VCERIASSPVIPRGMPTRPHTYIDHHRVRSRGPLGAHGRHFGLQLSVNLSFPARNRLGHFVSQARNARIHLLVSPSLLSHIQAVSALSQNDGVDALTINPFHSGLVTGSHHQGGSGFLLAFLFSPNDDERSLVRVMLLRRGCRGSYSGRRPLVAAIGIL